MAICGMIKLLMTLDSNGSERSECEVPKGESECRVDNSQPGDEHPTLKIQRPKSLGNSTDNQKQESSYAHADESNYHRWNG